MYAFCENVGNKMELDIEMELDIVELGFCYAELGVYWHAYSKLSQDPELC